ncbi:hypothetical protein GP486_004097 [Trichoglossum hirsutum]|uniref:Uncharacterized protein n=1 Tax=Trichoglossum hirsutum TaxID=265104 RepID=A0A9P8LBP2_9PEZI|nr:hypothetical protein GP486_004097 [Trichoglossum hirsutum]
MAARAQAQAATPSSSRIPHREAVVGDGWKLPKGACNFRESSLGGGIKCGCRRFWIDRAVSQVSPSASSENGAGNGQNALCMCRHHACFHDEAYRPPSSNSTSVVSNPAVDATPVHVHPEDADRAAGSPLYVLLRSPANISRGSTVLDPSASMDRLGPGGDNAASSSSSHACGQRGSGRREYPRDTAGSTTAAEKALSRLADEFIPASKAPHSQVSSSGLPPIPSQCLMPPEHLNTESFDAILQRNDGKASQLPNKPSAPTNNSNAVVTSQHPTGLGLSLVTEISEVDTECIESVTTSANSSFVKHRLLEDQENYLQSKIEQELSLSATNKLNSASAQSTPYAASTISVFHPTQHRRNQTLWKSRSFISPRNAIAGTTATHMAPPSMTPEGTIQTEAATPSQQGTPDLRTLDHLETRRAVKELIGAVDALDKEVKRIGGGMSHSTPRVLDDNGDRAQAPSRGQTSPATALGHLLTADGKPSGLISPLSQLLPPLKSLLAAYPTILDVVKGYAARLDVLENASFSNAPVEDIQQEMELVEGRVLELEGRVEELEKWRTSHEEDSGGSITRRHRTTKRKADDGGVNDGSTSFVSNTSSVTNTSSTLIAAAVDRSGMLSRIDSLSSRLHELESSAPPSLARPWEVEIIFTPWGRSMKGVWFAEDDFPAPSSGSTTQTTEGWIQPQGPIELSRRGSMQILDEKSGGWSETAIRQWARGMEPWMVPKACSQKSRVYERLRSRGLVRTIQVSGNGAADVQAAMIAAFGSLMETLNGSQDTTVKGRLSSFSSRNEDTPMLPMGLSAPFIPLRKLHRESRLRFLNPEEMLTPALWTVDFLASSAVMMAKAGQKLLFVTHRDGYIQSQDERTQWTWQKLRELPRVDPTGQSFNEMSSGQVHEADAKEPCWEWDGKLDPPISSTSSSSFASITSSHGSSQHSYQVKPTPLSPDRHSSDESEPNLHKSPHPISPVSQFPHSNHRCRTSTPRILPNPFLNKRHRPFWTSTPRRSNPPSPFFSEIGAPFPGSSAATAAIGGAKRGTTPSAYATPYSGPIAIDNRGRGAGSATGIDDEKKREDEDEIWEGVESEGAEIECHNEVVEDLVEKFLEESGGEKGVVVKEESGDEFFEEESAAWDS